MGARLAGAGGRQQPWGAEQEARLLRATWDQPYWLGQKVELAWISRSGRVGAVWEHFPEQDFAQWKKNKGGGGGMGGGGEDRGSPLRFTR